MISRFKESVDYYRSATRNGGRIALHKLDNRLENDQEQKIKDSHNSDKEINANKAEVESQLDDQTNNGN